MNNIVYENEIYVFYVRDGKYYRRNKLTQREDEMQDNEVNHMYNHIHQYDDDEYYHSL